MKLRIGLVGTGTTVSIGASHVNGFKTEQRAEVTAIFNRTFKRSEEFIKAHNLDAIAYSSYDELLDNVDGVVICTPNDSHVDYAIRALQKDVAVLLEKPISNSFDSAKQLMEVAKTAKAFNMIGYTNRFSNQVQAMKKLVSEKMTRVFHVNITYGGQRCSNPLTAYEWRMSKAYSGNGALIDYGSHAFD
ncbi:MAG: Gfo/Idh/MocA family oxidoreductase, partial [Clostridia bacterium]